MLLWRQTNPRCEIQAVLELVEIPGESQQRVGDDGTYARHGLIALAVFVGFGHLEHLRFACFDSRIQIIQLFEQNFEARQRDLGQRFRHLEFSVIQIGTPCAQRRKSTRDDHAGFEQVAANGIRYRRAVLNQHRTCGTTPHDLERRSI